jgi:hypothetical protein
MRFHRDALLVRALQCNPALHRNNTMEALLNKYRANPTAIRHAAVLTYYRKHPFCECLLRDDDLALLRRLSAFKA